MERYDRTILGDYYSSWARSTSLYVRWAAEHDMGYYEMLVLYALNKKGSMTQKAISDFYGVPKQTVNSVIRSLRAQGHAVLSACDRDKREKLVVLTPEGRAYSGEKLAPLFELEEQVCKNMDQERLRQMIETEKLYNLLFEAGMEGRT